jgi:hypothetical protein
MPFNLPVVKIIDNDATEETGRLNGSENLQQKSTICLPLQLGNGHILKLL